MLLSNSFDSPITIIPNYGPSGSGSICLVWAGQSPASAVQLDGSITISANWNDPRQFESALYRGLSFFVLGHIRDNFMKEAFQTLSEIYQWQIDSEKIVPLEPKIVDFGSTPLQQIDREPFQRR
jgi:hypothetical protein